MTQTQLMDQLALKPDMCQVCVAAAPLEHDGGVVYLSNVSEGDERVGVAHIYIWDSSDMGRPEAVREAVRGLFAEHRLDRILCEIDTGNTLALNMAARVGFNEIGVVRQRKLRDGGVHSVVLFDALPGDMNGTQ